MALSHEALEELRMVLSLALPPKPSADMMAVIQHHWRSIWPTRVIMPEADDLELEATRWSWGSAAKAREWITYGVNDADKAHELDKLGVEPQLMQTRNAYYSLADWVVCGLMTCREAAEWIELHLGGES